MKKISLLLTVLFCLFLASCCSSKTSEAPAERNNEAAVATQSTDNQTQNQLTTRNMENLTKVLFKTSEGDITIAKGDDAVSVVVSESITVVNAMEKLYMTVVVA